MYNRTVILNERTVQVYVGMYKIFIKNVQEFTAFKVSWRLLSHNLDKSKQNYVHGQESHKMQLTRMHHTTSVWACEWPCLCIFMWNCIFSKVWDIFWASIKFAVRSTTMMEMSEKLKVREALLVFNCRLFLLDVSFFNKWGGSMVSLGLGFSRDDSSSRWLTGVGAGTWPRWFEGGLRIGLN